MQEIEIKFKVDNLSDIKDRLKKKGCIFSKELNQKDTIFVPDLNNTVCTEGSMWIRIRSVNDKIELNLKKRSKSLMQAKEIEFEVSDFNQAYDFLTTLGLKEWVTVEKKRVTTEYKEFNICIDEVKRLGQFIEIELLTTKEDKTEYFEKIIVETAKELGINIANRINSFYDIMINELNNSEKVE